uniref:Uncharacterized protein n=1 Tax=Romanomermis culicivorax TaxID=13658 RepID=A0A915IZ07_ROMCU
KRKNSINEQNSAIDKGKLGPEALLVADPGDLDIIKYAEFQISVFLTNGHSVDPWARMVTYEIPVLL